MSIIENNKGYSLYLTDSGRNKLVLLRFKNRSITTGDGDRTLRKAVSNAMKVSGLTGLTLDLTAVRNLDAGGVAEILALEREYGTKSEYKVVWALEKIPRALEQSPVVTEVLARIPVNETPNLERDGHTGYLVPLHTYG